ncbi:histone H1-I-like [Helianthus annuus]|uniref:histone H1-I-like n=1 Tax=Helianthus annuus TaxID=4232 RepID=UPI000B8F4B53|nr:histone H1-I-like [Helianthus annuus]
MKNFGRPTPRQKPNQNPETKKKSSETTTAETPVKEKGLDETLNKLADEVEKNRKTIQNQNETNESQWRKEQKERKEWEIKTQNIGTSTRRKCIKPPLAKFSKPPPQKQTPKKPSTAGLKTTGESEKPPTATPKTTPSPQKPPAKK